MNIKYIYIVFLFLISCKSQFDFENSTFFYKNKIGNSSLIKFYKDGRFDFHHREGGLIKLESSGTWKKTKHRIILKSDKTYKTGIVSSKEQVDNSFNKVKIIIKDSTGFINEAVVILDEIKTCYTNIDGTILLSKKPTKITIYFLGEKYKYFVKNKEANIIEITINLNNLSSYYFDDETWILNKNSIVNSWNEKMILR